MSRVLVLTRDNEIYLDGVTRWTNYEEKILHVFGIVEDSNTETIIASFKKWDSIINVESIDDEVIDEEEIPTWNFLPEDGIGFYETMKLVESHREEFLEKLDEFRQSAVETMRNGIRETLNRFNSK